MDELKYNEMSNLPLHNTNMKTIAVVDDEPDIVELLTVHLRKAGYRVRSFADGSELFKYLKLSTPDLLILDLMLPDADGFEICNYMKKTKNLVNIPIMMLTARSHETDKILGLELGAEDYMTKPFSPRELIARVKVILRREEKINRSSVIVFADILQIDIETYTVKVKGKKVNLTSSEFKILRMLAENPNKVNSREKILEQLGNYEKGVMDRTVDVHIRNLRDKLADAGSLIKNIRGVGYKITDEEFNSKD